MSAHNPSSLMYGELLRTNTGATVFFASEERRSDNRGCVGISM
jgi:hypothetical protein